MTDLYILFLLTLFVIKHFIADFVLQFDYMVRDKGIYGATGGLHHSMIHACFTLLILIIFCDNANVAISLAFLDFVAHYHIDWAKMQIGKRQGYTPADNGFWFWLGFDQALHYLTYIAITGYLVVIY